VHNKEEAAGWGRAAWWCFFGRGAMLKGWHDLDQSGDEGTDSPCSSSLHLNMRAPACL
jgi:hypothetical protein